MSVLVPQEIEMELTPNEYLIYLEKLIEYQEFHLLRLSLKTNKKLSVPDRINEFFEKCDKYEKLNQRNSFVSAEDYIRRTEPKTLEKGQVNRFYYVVYRYKNVVSLTQGQTFGEVALGSDIIMRTATIITENDCAFGVMLKENYQQILREIEEKNKALNVSFLL